MHHSLHATDLRGQDKNKDLSPFSFFAVQQLSVPLPHHSPAQSDLLQFKDIAFWRYFDARFRKPVVVVN